MDSRKIGTVRVILNAQGVCVNQAQDRPLLVADGGPFIPARLFEGAWTSFIIQSGLSGDNGVAFHDARPATEDEAPELMWDPQLAASLHVEGRYSVMHGKAFHEPMVYGLLVLDVDVYDLRQIQALRSFFDAIDDGWIRIGGRRSVHGACLIQDHGRFWIEPDGTYLFYGPDPAPAAVPARSIYNCANGHPQSWKTRRHGGYCPDCGTEVEPQWLTEGMANRPHQGAPRQWGEATPLMESAETHIQRDLGLEMPFDLSISYCPPFAEFPEHPLVPVTPSWLDRLGLPRFPWPFYTCKRWRARLDILAGLGIAFKAQPGVSRETAVTAAAVIHRFLTGFHLTPENSGEWAKMVNEERAEAVLQEVWCRIEAAVEIGRRTPTYHEIVSWVLEEFDIVLCASVERLMAKEV